MSAGLIRKLGQARERLQQGDVAGAQFLCDEILRDAPRNPDALHLLGVTYLMAGRPHDAVPVLQQAVAIQPRNGAALESLGLAQLMLGEFAEAERVLRGATALPGAPASVFMRLGSAILNQGRHAEAVRELQRALEMEPQNADAHLNLGQAHAKLGDTVAARQHFEAALRLAPAHADAMFNLGVLSLNQEDLVQAQQRFERAIALSPGHADALVNLGIVYEKQQRADEAIACWQRALAIDPGLAQAHNNIARTLALRGRREEAREHFLAAIRNDPALTAAHEGLATVCRELGRFREAISHLREVMRAEPANQDALAALAHALFETGELGEAESIAQGALALNAKAAWPYDVLGIISFIRGDAGQAAAIIESGFKLTTDSVLLGVFMWYLRNGCDWARWRDNLPGLIAALDNGQALNTPTFLQCEPVTAAQQLTYARQWAADRFGPGTESSARAAAPRKHPRIRVGYLSTDFHHHATAYLLAGVLERHDRGRFEVFAYSYGPDDKSPMRARVREASEHFVDILFDPDDVAARRIRDDELDIFVDLKGFTAGARTALIARRLCPIQVNWLGYPGTMGVDFIDYLIADNFIIPPGQESLYAERVLRMPHCYQPNDHRRPLADPLSRAEYGLPAEAFVFCCFNQAYKIGPEVFACWMNLLRNVPGSVLWLLEDNRWASENLKLAAQSHGVASGRLIFATRCPLAKHLARYRAADLALDTFPCASHTTASDALWGECLLVALCGDTFASRVAGSIVSNCGLPELVTYALADYEGLALRIASDPQLRDELRVRLKAAKTSAPLFDAAAFTRDLEQLYSGIVA